MKPFLFPAESAITINIEDYMCSMLVVGSCNLPKSQRVVAISTDINVCTVVKQMKKIV